MRTLLFFPRTELWPPNPFLLTPTFPLSLGSSKAGVPHRIAPPTKEAAFCYFWASGRVRGAVLENSRGSLRRREIKQKESINGEKRKARKQPWRGKSKGGGGGGKEKGKRMEAKGDAGEVDSSGGEGRGQKWGKGVAQGRV